MWVCINYMKPQNIGSKTDRKREIEKSTIVIADFNTLLSVTARTIRQKTGNDIEELKKVINQKENTSRTHRLFNKIDYILGHKTNLTEGF